MKQGIPLQTLPASQKVIWKYYEQLCPYTFDNVFEMDNFFEKHKLLLLAQYEIE